VSGPAHELRLPLRPQREGHDGAGSSSTIFRRAIEHGNVMLAEVTARKLGRLSLEDALRPLFLYAEKEPASSSAPLCVGLAAT
jgi:hypothetical protein